MNLIQYVASYGDLLPPADPEPKQSSNIQRTKVSSETTMSQNYILIVGLYLLKTYLYMFCQADLPSRPTSQTLLLAETEQKMLQDLMSEAMEETDGQHAIALQQNGKDYAW